jgi:hypothetical protein
MDGGHAVFAAAGDASSIPVTISLRSPRRSTMSAFPPLATKQRTLLEVRFVPNPEIAASFDHLFGALHNAGLTRSLKGRRDFGHCLGVHRGKSAVFDMRFARLGRQGTHVC